MADAKASGGGESRRTLELLQQQRRNWLEVEPGKKVRVVRPLAAQMGRFVVGVTVDHAAEFVDGWEGYSQADFLGSAVGTSDALDFDAELWGEYVRDNPHISAKVVTAIRDGLERKLKAIEDAKGN